MATKYKPTLVEVVAILGILGSILFVAVVGIALAIALA